MKQENQAGPSMAESVELGRPLPKEPLTPLWLFMDLEKRCEVVAGPGYHLKVGIVHLEAALARWREAPRGRTS